MTTPYFTTENVSLFKAFSPHLLVLFTDERKACIVSRRDVAVKRGPSIGVAGRRWEESNLHSQIQTWRSYPLIHRLSKLLPKPMQLTCWQADLISPQWNDNHTDIFGSFSYSSMATIFITVVGKQNILVRSRDVNPCSQIAQNDFRIIF